MKEKKMKELLRQIISSKFGGCLFAGLWFAIASTIPVGYYLIRFSDGLPILGGSVILTAIIPIILSGFMGMLLGSNILDTEETKSELKAIGLGFTVAMLSYLFLFIVPMILTIFTSGDIFGAIVAFVVFFLYGLLMVGWLVAIIGAATGLLLYLLRLRIF